MTTPMTTPAPELCPHCHKPLVIVRAPDLDGHMCEACCYPIDTRATPQPAEGPTPRTDAEVEDYCVNGYPPTVGLVGADFARTLEREVDRLRKCEAVCHCGERMSAHQVYSSCTTFVEMKETCPYSEDLHEARKELSETQIKLDEARRRIHEMEMAAKFTAQVNEKAQQVIAEYGNTMGRMAIALFGENNNRTDEECIQHAATLQAEVAELKAQIEQLHNSYANGFANINDTCRIRGFEAGPSGESTEDRVIALAQAYDDLRAQLTAAMADSARAWLPISSAPKDGTMVLGYSHEWIHEDYNPNGTRICFYDGDSYWWSAAWNNSVDEWENSNDDPPTQWQHLPPSPVQGNQP